MEDIIEAKTREIRAELSVLKKRLKSGDDSKMEHWVIPNKLACSQRPLRHHPIYGGSGKNISTEATPLVHDWAIYMQCVGIKSIICLMHARDLAYYEALQLEAPNLIAFYRLNAFQVEHLPWEDPHHSSTSPAQIRQKLLVVRKAALEAYDRLTKPVLMQCSAGIDRTAPVAAYVFANRAP